MSELTLGNGTPVAGHDPHYLAAVAALFEARLAEEDIPHWFTLSPMLIPGPNNQPVMAIMVSIFRRHVDLRTTINGFAPYDKLMSLLDPEFVDGICKGAVGELRQSYFSVMAQKQ